MSHAQTQQQFLRTCCKNLKLTYRITNRRPRVSHGLYSYMCLRDKALSPEPRGYTASLCDEV